MPLAQSLLDPRTWSRAWSGLVDWITELPMDSPWFWLVLVVIGGFVVAWSLEKQ